MNDVVQDGGMTSDYSQLLSRMIDAAKTDAAVGRNYVYELVRIRLLKHASSQTPPWSNTRILQELQLLDRAIADVEALASERQGPGQADGREPVPDKAETSDEGSRNEGARSADAREGRLPTSAMAWLGLLRGSAAGPLLRLGMVAGLILAVYAVLALGQVELPFLRRPAPPAEQATPDPRTPPPLPDSATTRSEAATAPAPEPDGADKPRSGIPVPGLYGVYALRGGQLIELTDLLPRTPGRGTATEGAIVDPSRLKFPDGLISFVIRRREFIAHVPERIAVNVVARIAREFVVDKGRKVTTPLSGLWLLRNVGSEYRVSQLPERHDTILVQPQPAGAVLPPGRYALMFNGDAYDFTIEGPATDPVHCVERTATLTEDHYQQCPTR